MFRGEPPFVGLQSGPAALGQGPVHGAQVEEKGTAVVGARWNDGGQGADGRHDTDRQRRAGQGDVRRLPHARAGGAEEGIGGERGR